LRTDAHQHAQALDFVGLNVYAPLPQRSSLYVSNGGGQTANQKQAVVRLTQPCIECGHSDSETSRRCGNQQFTGHWTCAEAWIDVIGVDQTQPLPRRSAGIEVVSAVNAGRK
jgi:hypothetical protein